MITFKEYQKIALSFPEVTEQPHFDNPSFRFKNKIFATYWTKDNKAMVKLSLNDQSVFCSYNNEIFYPVNGKWGAQGATFVNMDLVRNDMFKDALKCAYNEISRTKVSTKPK
jgi:YjbR